MLLAIHLSSPTQLLISDVTIDSISITPMQTTYAPNVDYMTDYDDWLSVQVSENTTT